jgi:hypothetical protein
MDKRINDNKEQVWVDKQFKDLLERIQAKRILAGVNCKSVSEVTKNMAENKKIRDVIDKELAFGIKIIKEGQNDENKLF